MNIKIGTGLRVIPQELLLSFDVNVPRDNNLKLNIGTEYTKRITDNFSAAIRAGIKPNTSPVDSVSVGLGLNYSGLSVDFAWLPYGLLGDTFKVSFGIKFGKVSSEKFATLQNIPSVIPTEIFSSQFQGNQSNSVPVDNLEITQDVAGVDSEKGSHSGNIETKISYDIYQSTTSKNFISGITTTKVSDNGRISMGQLNKKSTRLTSPLTKKGILGGLLCIFAVIVIIRNRK